MSDTENDKDNVIHANFGDNTEPLFKYWPDGYTRLNVSLSAEEDTGEEVWDIKQIKIALGPGDDDYGFMEVEVFSDDELSISFSGRCDKVSGENGWEGVENIPMDAARRLRDFLNYAIPD